MQDRKEKQRRDAAVKQRNAGPAPCGNSAAAIPRWMC